MPNVTLRAMALAEFDEWKPGAVQRYGEQQVQAGNIAANAAQEWAAGEYAKLLPQGLNSPGHHLLIAEQEAGTATRDVGIAHAARSSPNSRADPSGTQ